MLINDELAAGIMIIGVREVFLWGWPGDGLGWAIGTAGVAVGTTALRGWLPSVTDFNVIPW